MKYLIIENNTVVNAVLSDTPLFPNWVSTEGLDPSPSIGWTYESGVFTPPVVLEVPIIPGVYQITQFAFKSRLTDIERKAIRAASKVNEDIEDFMDLLNSAKYIDLKDATTRAGIFFLETAGLLNVGRALEILDTPINQNERP